METGTWEFVSLETKNADDEKWTSSNAWDRGILMLDDKHYAMQLAGTNRPAVSRPKVGDADADDLRALLGGYMSSAGTYASDGSPNAYRFDQRSGLFAEKPATHRLEVDGEQMRMERGDRQQRTTWRRVPDGAADSHPLAGMWTLEKAENRPGPEGDWNPFFVGSKGYTAFDGTGNRLWDVTLAGRTPMKRDAALDPSTDADELRALLRSYLVGLVKYELDESNRSLTQVSNEGVFPGEGVRDWRYEITDRGKLAITTQAGTFRATYQPWAE